MGLKCKYFNKINKKIQKKFKVASADPGLCRQDQKKIEKKNRFFLQSCPHRPCALAHRVWEGNFATLCGNAQPSVVTHRVWGGNFLNFIYLFIFVPPAQASVDPILCTHDLKKNRFDFKVANANPVHYRTRLQSCSHRPCEGNFDFFF
jgi:hypothetical protein